MLKNLGYFKDYEDNTIKSVFETKEKNIIEMSLLFNKEEMDVVCAPTHHFCNMGCKMCHLTNNKLNKMMVPINYDDFMEALIKGVCYKDSNKRRTNKEKLLISFMGVGEPLLNLKLIEQVYLNEHIIKEKLGYKEIGYAISTMMPNDNIKLLTDIVNNLNIPLKVHFSLHTPIDKIRKTLIPNTKVDVEDALNYLKYYREILQSNNKFLNEYVKFHRTDDPVEIHYTLIENVNDSINELDILCKLEKTYQIPIKFIRFNPTNSLNASKNQDIWINSLNKNIPNLRVKYYCPPGKGVGSSCGEFTKHYYHEEIETKNELKEFLNWKKEHEIFI